MIAEWIAFYVFATLLAISLCNGLSKLRKKRYINKQHRSFIRISVAISITGLAWLVLMVLPFTYIKEIADCWPAFVLMAMLTYQGNSEFHVI